jgi:hypothetical protein
MAIARLGRKPDVVEHHSAPVTKTPGEGKHEDVSDLN